MRTTLNLPDDLVREAMEITKSPTKTSLITTALEDLVRRRKMTDIKEYFGRVDLDVDLDAIRKR